MRWKRLFTKKQSRAFTCDVWPPYPCWILIDEVGTHNTVLKISHGRLHEVIGILEADLEAKDATRARRFFIDDSITLDDVRQIVPMLKQAVYRVRSELPEKDRHEV